MRSSACCRWRHEGSCGDYDAVGWVERSETRRCRGRMMGFATLNPSYAQATSAHPYPPQHPSQTTPAGDNHRSALPSPASRRPQIRRADVRSMKSASSSSKEMPPAVEIARAIGATPVSLTGTALIKSARLCGGNEDSDWPDEIAASCNRPMATGERLSALRRKLDSDCLPRGAEDRAANSSIPRSGRKATRRTASPDFGIASRSSAESA